jgi:hypothetical protein
LCSPELPERKCLFLASEIISSFPRRFCYLPDEPDVDSPVDLKGCHIVPGKHHSSRECSAGGCPRLNRNGTWVVFHLRFCPSPRQA